MHEVLSRRLPQWRPAHGLAASSDPAAAPVPAGWANVVGGHGEAPPPADALSMRAVARALLEADLVIAHQWYTRSTALARTIARLRPRTQVVVFDHGGSSAAGRRLADRCLPLPDLAAVQSEFEASITPMRARHSALVRGGIAPDRFHQDRKEGRDVDFLMVARFEPHKGQLLLLDALPNGATARLIGSSGTSRPDYKREVLSNAEAAGVPVMIDAPDDDLADAYRRARFIVQVPIRGSDTRLAPPELLGLTLLEGMASGCVPICPSTGPGTEFVRDGSTGFTYQAESVEDLRRTLTRALNAPADLETLAANAVEESRRWTWDAAADNVLAALGMEPPN